VPRVTLYHCTLPKRLPLIEEEGLRTRADLSGLYGPPGALDAPRPGPTPTASGCPAGGPRRTPGTRSPELGAGFVSYTVDPAKTLAAPRACATATRTPTGPPRAPARLAGGRGAAGRPRGAPERAGAGQAPAAARATARDEQLGDYAPLVAAVADEDRLSAKAIMHLAIIASDGDFDGRGLRCRLRARLARRARPAVARARADRRGPGQGRERRARRARRRDPELARGCARSSRRPASGRSRTAWSTAGACCRAPR
jgi:hypothetical protein